MFTFWKDIRSYLSKVDQWLFFFYLRMWKKEQQNYKIVLGCHSIYLLSIVDILRPRRKGERGLSNFHDGHRGAVVVCE